MGNFALQVPFTTEFQQELPVRYQYLFALGWFNLILNIGYHHLVYVLL